MSPKAHLAHLLQKDGIPSDYSQWKEIQLQVPELRLRKVGKDGLQIQMDGKAPFLDPTVWLDNYQAGVVQNLRSTLRQAEQTLSQEMFSQELPAVKVQSNEQEIRTHAYDEGVQETLSTIYLSLARAQEEHPEINGLRFDVIFKVILKDLGYSISGLTRENWKNLVPILIDLDN